MAGELRRRAIGCRSTILFGRAVVPGISGIMAQAGGGIIPSPS
jgi:hypothetical protein